MFKAIGTTWSITADEASFSKADQESVFEYVANFEQRFSRFLPDSEVNQFRRIRAGNFSISAELMVLLRKADVLRVLTDGVYDPAAGALLEKAGYDNSYSLEPSAQIDTFSLPHWNLDWETITLDGPVSFDLGGIGKGYCVDKVANLLAERGYQYIIVDAGGDMFGTSKADGSAWRVAIQYPGKPDTAAGVIRLKNQAVAVSDSFRRRWGKWHHLVDPKRKQAIQNIVGAVSVSATAWHADCMTSALFLGSSNKYQDASKEFDADYLVFKSDGTCLVSPAWKGELFYME